ncbi:unknown protein [Leptolyngbya sp. NIES-3755]|nr:unknown protein [Leptolyngbya sp. NIES-3755]
MSIAELSSHLEQLSPIEKLQLIHLLTASLLRDNHLQPIDESGGLHNSFEAAAVLAKFLADSQPMIHDRAS